MRCLSLIFVLFMTGCSTIKNVTHDVPYDSFLGVAKTTVDTFLCDDELGFFKPEISAELVINHGFEYCVHANHIISIPRGAEIELKSIRQHTGYGLFIVKRWYWIGQYSNGEESYKLLYQLPWVQDNDGRYMDIDKISVPWANGI